VSNLLPDLIREIPSHHSPRSFLLIISVDDTPFSYTKLYNPHCTRGGANLKGGFEDYLGKRDEANAVLYPSHMDFEKDKKDKLTVSVLLKVVQVFR